ncbi:MULTISPECIES: hypothetical protein [unclassified Nocardia]|nr:MULTISPECIES: hypothetical protein [unclassified Nocardia]
MFAPTMIHPQPVDSVPQAVLDALRAAHARGARITSVCIGAFTM